MKRETFMVSCLLVCFGELRAGSAVVSWDPNTEGDLSGYKIYYGKKPGEYTNDVFVGNVTSKRISGLEVEKRYYFVVTAFDFSGNESKFSSEVSVDIPKNSTDAPDDVTDESIGVLAGGVYNFPNPFRVNKENTTIRYKLSEPAEVTIEILDMNNQLVKRIIEKALRGSGEHTEEAWDGSNFLNKKVANGVYFCRIRTARQQRFVKIAVIR
ncbi:MAG: FlgD immunoglobulin-like domain containing protein [bacterium]